PIPKIFAKVKTLQDVGLGYITLGQQSTTLSGGEAQRIKLATELAKRQTGNTLYILDEPTTGLHFEDVKVLMEAINKLVDLGNSFIIIEHNLDVIKLADHIIDIGMEGGNKGGEIIAKGTPEEVARSKKSLTAKFLKRELEQ
ncbi:MAG: ATP-binding cassette domain-containing protein, partial [Kaistella sp.]